MREAESAQVPTLDQLAKEERSQGTLENYHEGFLEPGARPPLSATALAGKVAEHAQSASLETLTAYFAEWSSEQRARLQALLPPAPSLDHVEYRAITLEQMNALFREEVESRADADGFLPGWYETRYFNR